MNITKLTQCAVIGISILLLKNNTSFASSSEDPIQSPTYKMMKSLQAMSAQMEPPLFDLGKKFNVKGSPVYLQYSDNVSFRPDPRDPEPIMRKGFKIFTHASDHPTVEVGYLIAQGTQYTHFSEPTIDLSWLFINESERGKYYGSYALKIFEGIFKHNTDKFTNHSILSARTNEKNKVMCHILEKNGWIQLKDQTQPNMVEFIKERPKKD